jgi:hypothetical protein
MPEFISLGAKEIMSYDIKLKGRRLRLPAPTSLYPRDGHDSPMILDIVTIIMQAGSAKWRE